jgi:hypothetical protein
MDAVIVKPAHSAQGCPVPTQACLSALETLYPRICAGLVQMWFRDGIDSYLDSLILDDRFDRRGFPLDVIDELLFLSDLRWAMQRDRRGVGVADADGEDFVFAPSISAGARLDLAWM